MLYDDEYPDHEFEVGEYRECDICGRMRVCVFEPNPLGQEIHDDDTPEWHCGGCAYESRMDI